MVIDFGNECLPTHSRPQRPQSFCVSTKTHDLWSVSIFLQFWLAVRKRQKTRENKCPTQVQKITVGHARGRISWCRAKWSRPLGTTTMPAMQIIFCSCALPCCSWQLLPKCSTVLTLCSEHKYKTKVARAANYSLFSVKQSRWSNNKTIIWNIEREWGLRSYIST